MNQLAQDVLEEQVPHAGRLEFAIRSQFHETQLLHRVDASIWLGAVKQHVNHLGQQRGTLYTAMDILQAAADLAGHYDALAKAAI